MLETLSHIFHKIYYYNETISSGASITGQIEVQVDAHRDARSFLVGGVSEIMLVQMKVDVTHTYFGGGG
jgi:hypothetical protein